MCNTLCNAKTCAHVVIFVAVEVVEGQMNVIGEQISQWPTAAESKAVDVQFIIYSV